MGQDADLMWIRFSDDADVSVATPKSEQRSVSAPTMIVGGLPQQREQFAQEGDTENAKEEKKIWAQHMKIISDEVF